MSVSEQGGVGWEEGAETRNEDTPALATGHTSNTEERPSTRCANEVVDAIRKKTQPEVSNTSSGWRVRVLST
jgi:hypothetical protein